MQYVCSFSLVRVFFGLRPPPWYAMSPRIHSLPAILWPIEECRPQPHVVVVTSSNLPANRMLLLSWLRLQQLWLHLLTYVLTSYCIPITTLPTHCVLLLSSSSPTTRKWSSEFEAIINTISQRCIHSSRQSLLTISNTSQIHIPTFLSISKDSFRSIISRLPQCTCTV